MNSQNKAPCTCRYETRNPYKSYVKVEVFDKGSSQKRRCDIEAQAQCSQDYRHCQYKLKLQRTPVPQLESEPWKMTVESECLYPERAYQLSQMLGKKVAAEIKAKWGPVSSPSRQYLNIKVRCCYTMLR